MRGLGRCFFGRKGGRPLVFADFGVANDKITDIWARLFNIV
jgi:hypothetical protein